MMQSTDDPNLTFPNLKTKYKKLPLFQNGADRPIFTAMPDVAIDPFVRPAPTPLSPGPKYHQLSLFDIADDKKSDDYYGGAS